MKRYVVISALLAAVMLTGCASSYVLDSSEAIAPAHGIDHGVPEEENGVPAVQMELITDMTASAMRLDRGTFSWDGAIACGIGAMACFEDGLIHATFDAEKLTQPPRVLLPEGAEIGFVNCHGRDGNDYIQQDVEFSAEGEIFLPEQPVGPAYEVYITFGDGNYCHYMFATERAPEVQSGDTEPAQLSSPPQLKLFTATDEIERSYTLNSGNYSWTIVDGDVASETIACGASPLQSAASGHAVTIPCAQELIRSPRLMLPEGAEITRVNVWRSEDDFYEVEFTEDGEIILAESGKGCVYSVTVVFPQGSAEYVFAVEELCGYPTAEDMRVCYDNNGLWHPEARISRTDDFDGWEGLITVTEPDERFPQYDEEFFASNALVITTMTEGSGSVSHEFLGIDRDNVIHIGRSIPMVGTCDMAKYELVIEIPKSMADAEFRTIYDDEREFDELSPLF